MNKELFDTDIVIIGAGIIGLSIAKELCDRWPKFTVTIVEKESSLAAHASGRNSGVLHAGFYYPPDSLKARFTMEGNRLLTEYCIKHRLKIDRCGKVVVVKNEKELETLHELKKRGDSNGVDLKVIDEKELCVLEPNARTYQYALYSPTTSTIDPKEIVAHVANSLTGKAAIFLGERFERRVGANTIETKNFKICFKYLINTAGLYADKIAHDFDLGHAYVIVPFKGLYIRYHDDRLIGRHVYPVPDLQNPFLGVHFTKTVDGKVKIGPTAIPAFWRENYHGMENFKFDEVMEILFFEMKLFFSTPNFRRLAFEETKKYWRSHMRDQASFLVKGLEGGKIGEFLQPGIRAQLLDTRNMSLVTDFVLEYGENSAHVLNAVSPAFTCSFPFSKFIVDEIERRWIR